MVSFFCRFWVLNDRCYYALLGFFRSNAWSLNQLIDHWSSFVLAQDESVFIQDRLVFLGDHTRVSKDGRRMPGVVSIHQDSETQSKPSYFRGQYLGGHWCLNRKHLLPILFTLDAKNSALFILHYHQAVIFRITSSWGGPCRSLKLASYKGCLNIRAYKSNSKAF